MATKKSTKENESEVNPVEVKTEEMSREMMDEMHAESPEMIEDVSGEPGENQEASDETGYQEQAMSGLEVDPDPDAVLTETDPRPIFLVVTKSEALSVLITKAILKHYTGEISAIVPYFDTEMTLVEKITDFISGSENEKIILMDGIMPVNMFTIGDIEAIYGVRDRHGWNHNVHAPLLLERTKIVELLEENQNISDHDFIQKYTQKFRGELLPVITDWKTDSFTLPIVSENPSTETLKYYLPRKRWFYVSDKAAKVVLGFFNEE